jgi:hypothetical protein
MHMPLALLSPMAQSGHGVTQVMEVAVVDKDLTDVFLAA